jgi:hypothetical protein
MLNSKPQVLEYEPHASCKVEALNPKRQPPRNLGLFEPQTRYKADASKDSKSSFGSSSDQDHIGFNVTRTASESEKPLVLQTISNEASPIPLIDAVGNLISAGEVQS